jgi:Protein of unknown function (DUF3800)
MKLCYIDESGDLGMLPATLPANSNDQPVLIIGGLFFDSNQATHWTHAFLNLKHRYFPNLPYPSNSHLDRIIPEIKGADLRRNAIRGSARQRHHAIGFLDSLLALLQAHDVRLVARIWVKALGQPFSGRSVYTSSIQGICTYFNHYLDQISDFGLCVADSRYQILNVNVSHSVFTQKFRSAPPAYGRLVELPTFGHSENHAGIQLCDIICSALLFPIACYAYCTGFLANVHVQSGADLLRQRYGPILKSLQYRYQEPNGHYTGGLVVSDALQQRNATAMFR